MKTLVVIQIKHLFQESEVQNDIQNDEDTITVDEDMESEPENKNIEKKFHCTNKCKSGCKSCICSKNGELCDSTCNCNNCDNNQSKENPLKDWREDPFPMSESLVENFGGPLIAEKDELQIFSKFWTNEMWEHIVSETNEYRVTYSQKFNQKFIPEVTILEIKKFMAICLEMGIAPLPSIDLYWRGKNHFFGNKFISKTMSRYRFQQINAVLHFQVGFLQTKLNSNFKNNWQPYRTVVVDEGIIPFKGRYRYKQYVRGKPHSTGIKYFALADEKGYLYSFWQYKGKEGEKEGEEEAKPTPIVVNLLKTLPKRKYLVVAVRHLLMK